MKTYNQVVKERYNRPDQENIYNNIYSLSNPIGFYGAQKIQEVFFNVFNYLKKDGLDLRKIKILDLGCGSGQWSRFFAEILQDPARVSGIDLSNVRVKQANEMNPKIKYICDDIVNLQESKQKWDIVTAIDVFMHLNTEKQILKTLNKIYKTLKDNGIFIFYDAYAKDHFISEKDVDSSGFNSKQIELLCAKAGFKKIIQKNIFKKIFNKYHSVYLFKKYPKWIINFTEKILPGSPGNILIVFKKEI